MGVGVGMGGGVVQSDMTDNSSTGFAPFHAGVFRLNGAFMNGQPKERLHTNQILFNKK